MDVDSWGEGILDLQSVQQLARVNERAKRADRSADPTARVFQMASQAHSLFVKSQTWTLLLTAPNKKASCFETQDASYGENLSRQERKNDARALVHTRLAAGGSIIHLLQELGTKVLVVHTVLTARRVRFNFL